MKNLHPTLVKLFEAINRLDGPAILATFADDALIVDSRNELWGKEAIAKWFAKEFIGDKVSVEITDVIHHYGETIVRGRYEGNFDRTNLPAEVILTHCFRMHEDKIVGLFMNLYRPVAA